MYVKKFPPSLLIVLLATSISLQPPALPSCAGAAGPRVLPPGQVPQDTRLGPLRGETGDFSFTPAASVAEWESRAEHVRKVMRVALGLWPAPTKTPLNAVIHGKLDRGDHTVEKVYFESVPGFFVTGNLYRPKSNRRTHPAVLSPHGHFPGGRFQDEGLEHVRRQIADGAERFEEGGRSFMQSRCVQLARMGCVVFHYDMIGYGDSVQIPLELAHRFSRDRMKFQQPPASGFYGATAESWLVNMMGLHTYNSIRALDFLSGLPDVDPNRIAVTGGSGGGTQTFMLCAVDERPLVSVPAVIVSTTRQGGCTCENVCGLRIGTYNLEFTALHAPKPLLLISADDATRDMPTRGFPELKQHYRALGGEEHAGHVALLQFPHNYNHVSRTAMYHWLNRHLGLGLDEPIHERPYRRQTREQMTVWNDEHPRPDTNDDFESKLVDELITDARRQVANLYPSDAASLDRYRETVGGAWDVLLRVRPSDHPSVEFLTKQIEQRERHQETAGLLRYRTIDGHRAELPAVVLAPRTSGPRAVVWIDAQGKSAFFASDGSVEPYIRSLLDRGVTVYGVDLLLQGEFLIDGPDASRARWLDGEQAFAGWTYCYNLPPFAHRVHDVTSVVALARSQGFQQQNIDLVGLGPAGPWAAAAAAQLRSVIRRAAIDTDGFRFAELTDVYDINFLPGAAKYGDLPGLLALAAPTKLWLAGEGNDAPSIVIAAYRAARRLGDLTVSTGANGELATNAVEWLLAE